MTKKRIKELLCLKGITKDNHIEQLLYEIKQENEQNYENGKLNCKSNLLSGFSKLIDEDFIEKGSINI